MLYGIHTPNEHNDVLKLDLNLLHFIVLNYPLYAVNVFLHFKFLFSFIFKSSLYSYYICRKLSYTWNHVVWLWSLFPPHTILVRFLWELEVKRVALSVIWICRDQSRLSCVDTVIFWKVYWIKMSDDESSVASGGSAAEEEEITDLSNRYV